MSDQEASGVFSFKAVIFDLDGVITKTALVHATSWKAMFDEYLKERSERENVPFEPFDYKEDYLPYVDGKPRYEGVKSFLESRDIKLPFGDPEDDTSKETICGVGNRKNIKFKKILAREGVDVYPFAVELIKELISSGIHVGVASSSKNCQFVLESAGIADLFETRIDGIVSAELGLHGKPEGDIFVKASDNLGVSPEHAIVVEDAVSGVQAGVNGGFGLVIGVAREGNADALKAHGADIVIENFKDITVASLNKLFIAKAANHSSELT